MQDYAIKINKVTMDFNLSSERSEGIKEYIINRIKGKSQKTTKFRALNNISFNIKKGDSVAILGSNGSGKSTLLKLIAGIFHPTYGSIETSGVIAPMIELGAGFDTNLTARENIYLNGAVLGYDREFMDERFNEIIDFAELSNFVDVPVKNFSSGMQARLGFSIATLIKPDILIVDEILSVGDAHFQEKCKNKMNELKSGGTTLVLVSHSINDIKDNCKNAVWINKGELMKIGTVDDVCKEYIENKDL